MANDVVGFLRVLLSANTAEFDKAISQSQKTVKSFVDGLGKAVDGFKNLGGEGGALGGALDKVVGSLEGAVGGIGALGPAGAAAAVGVVAATGAVAGLVAITGAAAVAVYNVTKFAADAGDEMLNLHNKTGIAVEALSELKFVGEQADVPLQSITDSIFKLGQKISEGGDKVASGLKTIGLSFADLRKLSPDKAFELVIQRLHEIPDAGKRAAVGVALFGKGFKEVAQLAEEDIGGLIDQAHKLGLVMSSETAVAGDRFNDALHAIGAQISALEVKIGAQLLPVAVALVETFGTQLTNAFQSVTKNSAGLGDVVSNVSVMIAQALAAVVSVAARAAQFLVEFFSGQFITSLGILDLFGEFVTGVGSILVALSSLHPELAGAGSAAMDAGMKLQQFAVKGALGVAQVSGTLTGYAKAVDQAATMTGIALPAAVAKVRAEIAKTADGMRAASSGAAGFGAAMGEVDKQTQDAAKSIATVAKQIDDAATRGMSAGDMVTLFGKDAIEASTKAEKFGLTVSEGIRTIARDATNLVNAEYFAKIADQAREGNLKIIAEADKRQQKEGEGLVALATANANYYDEVARLSMTGTDREIADINRKMQAELLALPAETAANKQQLDIRKQQIEDFYAHQYNLARGTYDTIVERMRAAGVATRVDLQKSAVEAYRDYKQMAASGMFSADAVRQAWENSLHKQAEFLGGFKGDLLNLYAGLADQIAKPLADMLTHWKKWRDDLKSLWHSIQDDFAQVLENMLKRWIEGFLMKLLDSLTGSRGAFASAFSGLLPGIGGGGGLPGLGGIGSLFGGGAAVGGIGTPVAGGAAGTWAGTGATTGGIGSGLAGIFGGLGAAGAGFGTGALFQHLFGGNGAAAGAAGGGSGALEGALIGSIVPGIGTAIGALIGGISGLLGGLINFGPSKKEVASRGIVSDFQQQTLGGLSDAQRTEAASAGWTDPQAAGTLIAVRDAYMSIGKSSQDAERDVKALWDSEKQGPDATNAAMAPLLAALDEYRKKTQGTAEATSAAVDAQKKKYEELKVVVASQMADLNKQLDDLNNSEKPEEVMGVIEAQTREHIAAQQKALQEQLDVAAKAAADAVQQAGTTAASAADAAKQPIAQLPEDAFNAGRDAVGNLETWFRQLQIDPIHVPIIYDTPDGGPLPAVPAPGFAGGTPDLDFMDFGRESLVRLHGLEAVVPKGQQGAFAAKHGAMGDGGSSVTNVLGPVYVNGELSEAGWNTLARKMAHLIPDVIPDGGSTLGKWQRTTRGLVKA